MLSRQLPTQSRQVLPPEIHLAIEDIGGHAVDTCSEGFLLKSIVEREPFCLSPVGESRAIGPCCREGPGDRLRVFRVEFALPEWKTNQIHESI